MVYSVIYQGPAEAVLRKLPREAQARILRKVDQLAGNPFPPGTEKLNAARDLWRIRIGDYRVIYTVERKELLVLVLKVGHRREIYR
jgi:mRNA interferase RelE/StbE